MSEMIRDTNPARDEQSPKSHILLTGATGLLGRYLLKDLMLQGTPVAVVVRPSRRQSAADRIEAILQTWEEMLDQRLPRPVVLEGDICNPLMGLSDHDLRWVADNCCSLLHNAASLSFVSGDRSGEPWRSNIGGTEQALAICRETGITDFHHVSTAYVCGLRKGLVLESEVNVGQEFGNDYERSKIEAEQMVRSADFLQTVTVYRPGIIVGDSNTGFTTTFHGYYAGLRLAHTLRNSVDPSLMRRGNVLLRLTLDGDELKNLVPVDWVSAVIAHIVDRPEEYGRTYHLTSEQPPTMQMIYNSMEGACDLLGTAVMHGANSTIDHPSEVEELFYENMQVYNSYWRNDPTFDMTNTRNAAPHLPSPIIDEDRLLMMAKVAIEQEFRWKDKVPVRPVASVSNFS